VATVLEMYTAHMVDSYYTLGMSYCTFCVGKHTILGPARLGKTVMS